MDTKKKQQINRIFNMAERPIMLYIKSLFCSMNGADVSDLSIFEDKIPFVEDPLILMPWEDYKKDICLKFTVKPVARGYSLDLGDLAKHENVLQAIGFLYYAMKTVYASVVSSTTLKDKKFLDNTLLELNQVTLNMYPRFYHPKTIALNILNQRLSSVMSARVNNKFSKKQNDEFQSIIKQINAIKSQITEDERKEELKNNNKLDNLPILGIVIEELHKDNLPKPILSKEDEDRHFKQTMPNITNAAYLDPSEDNVNHSDELKEYF